VYNKALSYLKKAGTFILAASMLIWFASTYPKQPLLDSEFASKIEKVGDNQKLVRTLENELKLKKLEASYLGQIGKSTAVVFEPLGFDWRMTVALETGLAAKEVVVSTLGVLYAIGDEVDEESSSLQEQLRKNISFASAMAFIVFVMIYLPCLAASMVFAKEAGGYKYLAYLFVFTTLTAWVLSFVTYRILV
jgi:ferrous iron transport protein B